MKDQRGKTGKMVPQGQPAQQEAPAELGLLARAGLDSRVLRVRRELSARLGRLVLLVRRDREDLEVPQGSPVRWAIPVRSVFPGPRVRREPTARTEHQDLRENRDHPALKDRSTPSSSAHQDSPESRSS
jgi:hypothetical protein